MSKNKKIFISSLLTIGVGMIITSHTLYVYEKLYLVGIITLALGVACLSVYTFMLLEDK